MRRRDFAVALASAFLGVARFAGAQSRVPAIGALMRVAEDDPDTQQDLHAFRDGLQGLGRTPGSNVEIDYRYPTADPAQMRAYAAELVNLPVAVILAHGSPAVAALQRETRTTPIVFVRVADPVGQSFVASLAHPGGNVTGFTSFEYPIVGKWLELLKEIAPDCASVALMFNPETDPNVPGYLRALEAAAPSFAVPASAAPVRHLTAIERTVAALGQGRRGGLIVLPGPFTDVHREQIIALAPRHQVPAVYGYRYYTAAGGLISYGVCGADIYGRAAGYVDRILKGEKPADLPVQQPTRFELVINLKTAKALGLTVPPILFAQADEVIE